MSRLEFSDVKDSDMYTIVTHPGSAHKDDFLATSVLLASLDVSAVFRREPTPADLNDPHTFVVDVGMEYSPERHNFDHHHDHSLPCAFHLIMRHLGYHDAAMSMYIWYPHMSMMDVRGPYRTAEHLGVDSNILFASSSPIEGYIISTFAKIDSLTSNDPLFVFMKELGENMITMIDRKMKRLKQLKAEAKIFPIKHVKAVVSSIYNDPKLAMELYLKYLDDDLIVMSITPSNRGAGWELMRLGENNAVDFRAIAKNPEIRFVHTTGFLAKTHDNLAIPEVVNLASQAIAPALN